MGGMSGMSAPRYRMTWRYDRKRRRLYVSGMDLVRDLNNIKTMLRKGTIPKDLNAIVFRESIILRGLYLHEWLSQPDLADHSEAGE